MSGIRRNLAANIVGTALIAVLTVLLTPVQVNILGLEAFGIVGLVATLQVLFSALDLGLSSTVTRSLASDLSEQRDEAMPLIRTATSVYWGVSLLIGLVLFCAAPIVASRWFANGGLPDAVIADSIRVIAVYLALRWPAALYFGVLAGLQRLDVANMVKVAVGVIRLAGGMAVLLVTRSLELFLYWTAATAVIEVVAYACACKWTFRSMSLWPGYSGRAVATVWRFSVSMNALSVLGLLIVQIDRIALTRLQPLEVLGAYNLALTLASGLGIVIGALNSALFPWFTTLIARGDMAVLRRRYLDATLVMLLIVGGAAVAVMAFAKPLLTVWVSDDAARMSATACSILAAGFLVSALIANGYNVAVAAGRPNWHLRANVVGIIPYAALMVFLVDRFAGQGAALAWLALNLAYAIYLLPKVHGSILDMKFYLWLTSAVLPVMALSLVFPIAAWLAEFVPHDELATQLAALGLAGAVYAAGAVYLAKIRGVSTSVLPYLDRIVSRRKPV